MTTGIALAHGGRLLAASEEFRIPLGDWLDLSTGINPNGWAPPSIPADAWRRLPEEGDGLERAAARYYGTASLVIVPGSQAAIQALPELRARGRVGVPALGYAEHAHAWQRAGHELLWLSGDPDPLIDDLGVLIVIHPNNPTGERFAPDRLLEWHRRLVERGGWLVVDEAFIDCTPADSLAAYVGRPGLIVLRSLGKFFGLAGARVGAVLAEAALCERLSERLGPWTVSGPARHVARAAFEDIDWQARTRATLPRAAARLAALLDTHGLAPSGGSPLFQWVRTGEAAAIHSRLARQGVLVRRFDDPPSLRFGLPGSEEEWQRLDHGLARSC